MRIRSHWSDKKRKRSLEESAGVLAFIEWRIAAQTLLNLENEGFQTDTQLQRLEVLQELCAFLVHVTDRSVHDAMDDEERQRLIVQLALKIADTYQDNCLDIVGQEEDYRKPFIALLNRRAADYAEFRCDDGVPGYAFKRYLGECITNTMGPRDRKWISEQVMEIEVPAMLKTLDKALKDQLGLKPADATETDAGSS